MAFDYDVIVIGSGPAGEKGAAQAAALGKKVALVEKAPQLGGAGINTGTFPSKMLRETALYLYGLRQRGLHEVGYTAKPGLTLSDLMYHRQAVTEHAWGLIQHNLERYNIRVIHGDAYITEAHTVRVQREVDGEPEERRLTADYILIATGASPYRPPDIPFDHPRVYDSGTILNMTHLPRSFVVVGGGTIGCEYSSIFAALGAQVTLVEAQDELLPFVDRELATRLRTRFERDGVRLVFSDPVLQVQTFPDRVQLRLQNGFALEAEGCLFALGRVGNTHGLGLENVGIAVNGAGLITVNEHYQTVVENIYAAGDVIGFPALASTSMAQGSMAMTHAFAPANPHVLNFPLAVYTIPEIAMVGPSEETLKEQKTPYLVGRAAYNTNPRGQIIGDTDGVLKLLFSPRDRTLLAVHIIGEQASELIHIGAHVLTLGSMIDVFAQAVYNYPTLSDMYKLAALDGLEKWDWYQKKNLTA